MGGQGSSVSSSQALDDFSSAGAALKLHGFGSELKLGDQFITNPIIAGGTTRMLPQAFRGVTLVNRSVDNLLLEGGQVSHTNRNNQSGHAYRIETSYASSSRDVKIPLRRLTPASDRTERSVNAITDGGGEVCILRPDTRCSFGSRAVPVAHQNRPGWPVTLPLDLAVRHFTPLSCYKKELILFFLEP